MIHFRTLTDAELCATLRACGFDSALEEILVQRLEARIAEHGDRAHNGDCTPNLNLPIVGTNHKE